MYTKAEDNDDDAPPMTNRQEEPVFELPDASMSTSSSPLGSIDEGDGGVSLDADTVDEPVSLQAGREAETQFHSESRQSRIDEAEATWKAQWAELREWWDNETINPEYQEMELAQMSQLVG